MKMRAEERNDLSQMKLSPVPEPTVGEENKALKPGTSRSAAGITSQFNIPSTSRNCPSPSPSCSSSNSISTCSVNSSSSKSTNRSSNSEVCFLKPEVGRFATEKYEPASSTFAVPPPILVRLEENIRKEADKFLTSDSSLTSEDSESEARSYKTLRPKKSETPRKSRARSQSSKHKLPKTNQTESESPKEANQKQSELESASSSSTKKSSPKVAKKGPAKRMGAKCCKIKPVQKSNIIITNFSAVLEDKPTEIKEESKIVLRYKSPYFLADATVIFPPVMKNETWTVGWIQACSEMQFVNTYGELGCSSWEIPALIKNEIAFVSDSDGVSYPWYGSGSEIATIKGPCPSYSELNVKMNDNFHPSVTWDVPVSERENVHLTSIMRDQSFITWLAAVNESTGKIIVLKTVRWRFKLKIEVDPTKDLGERGKLVPVKQEKPSIQSGGNIIPKTALIKPSANNSQVLVWRPKSGTEKVVVSAKEAYNKDEKVSFFNGASVMDRKRHLVRFISDEEAKKACENAKS
ncbi:Oidioi.mRNA.OKI2018_I69.chr2.g4398.t1.cds [Oikopleura dioica]|uniref:Oidioi.mRNA.OKI2018_I69.chr2.g4398.t1.cds n=1 Tax=Oikopleura dioica TaxID=34765 RepID=A0ABN7SYT8_OIKDI|nr:Oidioi.mRNA.OKI2018_I69.chr2.g4398.t1.cds [Oikopleura dioica]